MKKKILLAMVAAVLAMGGCGEAKEESEPVIESQAIVATDKSETDGAKESAQGEEADSYEAQIKEEVAKIANEAGSLSKELVSINELYNKYDDMRSNAQDQASMNEMSKYGTQVWKEEVASLLERIKEKDASIYSEVFSEYEKWESNVPFMAEKMSEDYKDGSIYPSMYAYNEAMRYKRMAYVLASTLADVTKEADFVYPDSTRCGFYGDYEGSSYLTITEGMESGTYNVVIHIDDTKELRGWAEVEDAPDSDTYLLFTSDDGTVKGYVSHSSLEASFYVTETDNSVIGPEGAYTFSFKY
ncbi:MAG: hypothetical protein II477_02900 [Lachnospiraceae bacterium]|nr:hypothetical protein [Lachnospiraceae bacterium]